ncbi:N-acetylglucosaminyl-phosphatidylinositol deacetylase [Aspergillus cavernicola]|uniref:N-acetylglucosaminylphosphatidylinositol deacetylase n=1 Tax=Aspergillus cavernicola TaxID=176166 RepID=A0ABR4IQS1_9EURO
MSPQSLVSVGFAVAAVFIFWILSSTTTSPFARTFPQLYNKRICLLIAHPDDEAMFFAPTLLALTKPDLGNHVKILCLSSGDADGLGPIRREELKKSARHLGLRSDTDVLVLDDPRFKDSITTEWSKTDVASLLSSAFTPDTSNTSTSTTNKRKTTAPSASIDILLTFDIHGISNHPNHRSLHHGALHFLYTLMQPAPGYTCPVSLYTLTTTNLLRKYIGILDAPLTMVRGVFDSLFSSSAAKKNKKNGMPARLLFVSSVGEWMTAQKAMVLAHQSQMVWFRWGWIGIGRYMVVNDLKRVG